MHKSLKVLSAIIASSVITCTYAIAQSKLSANASKDELRRTSWIDDNTGHRVIRLTSQAGSKSLYFNYTAFSPDGKQMVYIANKSIYIVDLRSKKSQLLASGPIQEVVVSKNEPLVYFMKLKDQNVYVADMSTGDLRRIATLPDRATISTINSDGTLLAGTYIEGTGKDVNEIDLPSNIRPSLAAKVTYRSEAKIPMVLFALNIKSGNIIPILHSTDWLNHPQFSPKNPFLLMYCHEGMWQDVDRIWTIKTDGSNNTLIHERTMKNEIAGHEFWDTDGKTIWYDLQMPKGRTFYLASYNTETGERRRYEMNRNQWSTHFNGDLDSGIFCGDGSASSQVANASDGKWINLFRLKKEGVLESERLVDLSNHNYNVEPNARFTPDHKMVIFTSNMFGDSYVFAAEISLAKGSKRRTAIKHIFNSSEEASNNQDSFTEIQVVDSLDKPLPNAILSVKSLDNGHDTGVYKTDQNGMISSVDLENGLHRVTIVCADGACGNTIKEMFITPSNKKITIYAKDKLLSLAANLLSATTNNPVSTKIVVKNAAMAVQPNFQFMLRTSDAAQEKWYTTDKEGMSNVSLPAESSVIVFLLHKVLYTYRISSDCNSLNDNSGHAGDCVQVGNPTVITLPE